jgi:methionyl-tRNA synthetase
VHLVGKEIVRFHTIIWPAMLMALELPLPKKVFGHGWLLTAGGDKMSKSKGNSLVDPAALCARYGVDAVRYFLLREIPFGADGVFSIEALISRINSDLANDLGNLVSRTVTMAEKYFGGTVPLTQADEAPDGELRELALATAAGVEKYFDAFQYSNALADIWKFVSRTNKYIDETMPWALAKDPAKRDRLAKVIYNLCESIRMISVFIEPFMPNTAKEIRRQAGVTDSLTSWQSVSQFGLMPDNFKVSRGSVLFPRLDPKKELEELLGEPETAAAQPKTQPKAQPEAKSAAKAEPAVPGVITIDDFRKVSLRAAKVKACEKIEKSKKLLRLTLDDGEGERQVVSGIAQWYSPDDLVGKTIVVVANLAPAKLCGVESNGMILAADTDGGANVIFLDPSVKPGAVVR